MTRRLLFVLLTLAAWPLAVHAEHATIDLRVVRLDPETGQGKDETTASADQEPPQGGHNARPLFKAKVNEGLALQFILTNEYPHGDLKDVIVRYYVVREDKPQQKTLPDLSQGVVTRGQFVMNFKAKARVGSRVLFSIKEAGVYLLRVECANTNSDHEHFSAIDLQVD